MILEQKIIFDGITCALVVDHHTKKFVWRARGRVQDHYITPMEAKKIYFSNLRTWVSYVIKNYKIDI